MTAGGAFTRSLPGRYYHDPAIPAQEQERIFSAVWVAVGRASSVAAPGQFLHVSLGGERVLIVRGRDGEVRAMLGVCRHRGARLCTEAAGQLEGSIRCKYHGWTYGLDGRLLGAPHAQGQEGFDRERFGLVPVALEIWEGFLWLNLSTSSVDAEGTAPRPAVSLQAQLAEQRLDQLAVWARYRLGELVSARTVTYEVKANWKLVLENFGECCHCGPVHPELCERLPAYRHAIISSTVEGGTAFAPGLEGFSMSGKATAPVLGGLTEADHRRYHGIVLMPNLMVNLLPDHVVTHTLWPESADRTRIVCDWLYDPRAIATEGFDPTDATALFDLVNRQDWEVCELAQQGMTSRAYRDGGLFMPREHELGVVREFVERRLA